MSRALEAAAAIGGVALVGTGLLPFLHVRESADAWFEIRWPRVVDADAVMELLRHLASVRRPSVVVFEAEAHAGHIGYRVGVPNSDRERVRHTFATFLPDAWLDEVQRHSVEPRHALQLRLNNRERALRTDAPLEISRSLLGALSDAPGTFVVQWTLGSRLAPMHVPAQSVGAPSAVRLLKQALTSGSRPLDARGRTAFQAKVGDHGFRARLVVGSSVREPKIAHASLRRVFGALRVAESPGVHWKVRKTNPAEIEQAKTPHWFGIAINVAELAGLLAWPLGDGAYQGVNRVASRRLAVPSPVPKRGRVIGDGNHPQTLRPIAISMRDALLHTHALGPTGVGKSTLLANQILEDIDAGCGVIVVEPKGDLVDDLLARIPEHRVDDVVVLDPTDDVAPVGLNPLAGGNPALIADQLLSVFRGLYGELLGPRTTDVLHAALLTLARSDRATLVALPLLLTDGRLRRDLVAPVRDDLALGPFWQWYDGLSEPERQQVIAPSLNKVRRFIHAPMRSVVGQLQPRFHISQVFSERKILLVSLNKGIIGGETASLLGSLVVAQLWQAAQARARLAPEDRHPVSVVIDEFQDFVHLPTDLADVLTMARSYGLATHLAHQHLAQLTPATRAAVLANARNRICFRLSPDDASVMARTSDVLEATDFQSLGRYEIYAALVADGETQPYCSATTRALPPPKRDPKQLRALSRERFGRNRTDVESELRAMVNASTVEDRVVGKRKRGTT